MLVPVPYEAPKKEANKKAKEARGSLRHRGASDTKSEDSSDHPSSDYDKEEEEDEKEGEDEEEEELESPMRGRKKRTASSSLEADSPKRGRTSIPEAPPRLSIAARSGIPGPSPW